MFALLLVPAAFLLAGFGSAAAQDDDGAAQVVRGRVQNEFEEDGEEVREGVADVRIVVETADGELVAEAVTDAEGNYEIAIEEPGTYNVRLDTDTLPEGITVPEGETDDVRGRAGHGPTAARRGRSSSARICARPRASGASFPRRSPTASSWR